MPLARADFLVTQAIDRHVRSYAGAYVSPAEQALRAAEAERAAAWEARTIVFGDADWVEPRRRG